MDASVILKWFLREPDSAAADLLLEQFLNNEADLIAPDLILVGTASALWKRARVRNEMSVEEAALVFRDALTIPLALIPSGTVSEAAFQIALRHRHSVYDAIYCALATSGTATL